jgi:hypothetical protein
VVKVSDLWLERYVEFTTNHYLHLLIWEQISSFPTNK